MTDLAALVPDSLLQILRCPLTGTALTWVPEPWIPWLNDLAGRGELLTRGGRKVAQPILGALWNEDRSLIYPVYDHGATLVIDEAFVVSDLPAPPQPSCA